MQPSTFVGNKNKATYVNQFNVNRDVFGVDTTLAQTRRKLKYF